MVALIRDEHTATRNRCASLSELSPEARSYDEARRASEQRDDEDASGITRDIIRLSGVVCLGVLAFLGWVAWLYMR